MKKLYILVGLRTPIVSHFSIAILVEAKALKELDTQMPNSTYYMIRLGSVDFAEKQEMRNIRKKR